MLKQLIHERFDTNIIRCLGVILIVNSHLDDFFPAGYGYLATGGAIGNSLFFFASGYGLWFSLRGLKLNNFIGWMAKRCSRIYPAYWLALIFLIPILIYRENIEPGNLLLIASFFFYPNTAYWFLQAILPFYAIIFFWFVMFSNKSVALYIMMIVLLVIYIFSYLFMIDLSSFSVEKLPFRLTFYLFCVILGMFVASSQSLSARPVMLAFILLFLGLACFYGLKFIMLKGGGFNYQFLFHASTIGILLGAFWLSRSNFAIPFYNIKWINKCICFIGGHSLEIYLVHLPVAAYMRDLGLVSPLMIIVLLGISGVLAHYLKIISERMYGALSNAR